MDWVGGVSPPGVLKGSLKHTHACTHEQSLRFIASKSIPFSAFLSQRPDAIRNNQNVILTPNVSEYKRLVAGVLPDAPASSDEEEIKVPIITSYCIQISQKEMISKGECPSGLSANNNTWRTSVSTNLCSFGRCSAGDCLLVVQKLQYFLHMKSEP